MGGKSLVVNGYTPSEIKALFPSEDKYKIRIRLYAIYHVLLGYPSRVHRFDSEGFEGFKNKPDRRRIRRLTKDRETELQDLLLESKMVFSAKIKQ